MKLLLIIVLFLAGCSFFSNKSEKHKEEILNTDVEDITIDNLKNAKRFKNIYISGQPNSDAIKSLKNEGINVVVDLRSYSEKGIDKKKILGDIRMLNRNRIKYVHIPISACDPEKDLFYKVDQVIKDNPYQKILVHCSSGNRAAAWFSTWLVSSHGLTSDEAIKKARDAGLTNQEMLQIMNLYFKGKEEQIKKIEFCQ